MTLENRGDEPLEIYYQIDYVLTQIEGDAAYFCAQFRRVNPLPYKETYTILDGMRGQGALCGHRQLLAHHHRAVPRLFLI